MLDEMYVINPFPARIPRPKTPQIPSVNPSIPQLIISQKLKSALWFQIGHLITEETSLLSGVSATPQFIGALTEMVWVQLENVAQDLSSFAQHAGRRVVNTDDVLLLCRRNEPLEELVRGFVEQEMLKEMDGNGTAERKGKGRAGK